MPLILFVSFYLAEGGDLSIWGSDIRDDIFPYNFVDINFFLIIIIKLKVLLYKLFWI